jgi:ribosomal-protein-alanine N-acetyltransferase
MNAAPRLEAPGVVLRPLEMSDAEALFAAHSDPRSHQYWSSAAHKSVAQTAAYIEDTIAVGHAWAITESGGAALGRIGLFQLREGVADIGIIMRPDATGRGFASKALALVCAYGFDTLELHRIGADVDPDNSASLSLFLRAGFQREGLLRGNWKTHLGVRDSVILAKVRE